MTPADLLEILERIEAQNTWLVAAVKHLLAVEAGVEVPQTEPTDELEEWLAGVDPADEEWIAPIHAPKQQGPPPCTHQHQTLVDGVVRCARCGHPLVSSGLARGTVTPSGGVMPDPNPPAWAREHSPGASSKNPGGPLIPN